MRYKVINKVKILIGNTLLSLHSLQKYLFSLPCFKIDNNKIVFINFNGKGFGDNPKYIAEEIIRQKLDYKMIWLVKDINNDFPKEISRVSFRSSKALYELATARVIITNVKNDLRLNKRNKQTVIQTWHGSLSLKMIEREAEKQLTLEYVKESKKNSKQTDIFLSNSKLLTEQIRSSFWYEGEIIETGFPRNDILILNYKNTRNRIRKLLCIKDDSLIILYAPTFRDDGSVDAYDLDFLKIREAFKRRGFSNVIIWTRLHPNITNKARVFKHNEWIQDFTNYSDMQELIVASDVLITDYSSTVFDFAVLKKPVFIFATDIIKYNCTRGLKSFFFELPFPICKNGKELEEAIISFDKREYIVHLKSFMQFYGNKDTGEAAKKVVMIIKKLINTTK